MSNLLELVGNMPALQSTDWQRESVCKDADPKTFEVTPYPTAAKLESYRRVILEYCAGCKVTEICLANAVYMNDETMIAGGTTPDQREEIKRQLGIVISKEDKRRISNDNFLDR